MQSNIPLLEGLDPRLLLAAGLIGVNTFDDVIDPGDGLMSLREAIFAAAVNPGEDAIDLPAGQYQLTGGTLLIDDPSGALRIQGLGGVAEISGDGSNRVFEIQYGSVVQFDHLTVRGGQAPLGNGGGIYNAGELSVLNSTVMQSTSDREGGGIYNASGAWLEVTNSTIYDNYAFSGSGGIANLGMLRVENSTISGNDTDGVGGGLVNYGSAMITNATIYDNFASFDGGGIFNSVDMLLDNTIVAGNFNGVGGTDIFNVGVLGSRLGTAPRNNLIEEPFGHGIVDGVDGNIVGWGPWLGMLMDNGGPTWTHAIDWDSPALDNGEDLATLDTGLFTDQRGLGFERFMGPVDIGAYELQVYNEEPPEPYGATLDGFVWEDINGDGIRQPGDVGLGGVMVELFDAGYDAQPGTDDDYFMGSMTTDGNGYYGFYELYDGNYFVWFDLPEGYTFSPPGWDSDVTPSHTTPVVWLYSGDMAFLNAGMIPPPRPDIDVAFGASTNVHGHDFGRVIVGQNVQATFTIHNEGDVTLHIDQANGLPSPFTIVPSNGGDNSADDWFIEPGETLYITVSFLPDAYVPYAGTLTLYSNDPDETVYQIGLSGSGVEDPFEVVPYYEVWGGNTDYRDGWTGEWWRVYHNIDQQDYDYLGGSTAPHAVSTFAGTYDYYVIAARAKVQVDSVMGSTGTFGWSSGDGGIMGNTWENLSGAPDGQYLTVGFQGNRDTYAGFVVIQNPGDWTGVTLYTGDISMPMHVQIEQEVEYEGLATPGEYEHWVSVQDQGWGSSVRFQAPSGVWYDMWRDQDEDENGPRWEYGDDSFGSIDAIMERFGDGVYTVEAETPWGLFTTQVEFLDDTGSPLAWPTQKPVATSILHGATDVPTSVMLAWEQVTDPNVNNIWMNIEDSSWQQNFTWGSGDTSQTSLPNPVQLDPGTCYEWSLSNVNAYWGVTPEGAGFGVNRSIGDNVAFRTAGEGPGEPDLAVMEVYYTPGMYRPGDVLEDGDAQFGNIGDGNAIAFDPAGNPVPFWTEVRLSRDTVWGNRDDITIFRMSESYWLGGEIEYGRSEEDPGVPGPEGEPTIPEDVLGGNYYVALMMDSDGQIAESDETNNIWWSATPDITIVSGLLASDIKHVLSVGVRNAGVSYAGDVAAMRVHDAFEQVNGVVINNLLQLDANVSGNRQALITAIENIKAIILPGETFIFYIAAQAAHSLVGDELSVDAQYDTRAGFWEQRRATTGDEHFYLSAVDGADNYLSDDDFSELFVDPLWDMVNKNFIIDTPYGGGFFGGPGNGDSGDLSRLPRVSVLVAAEEADFAYMLPESGYSNFGVNTLGTSLLEPILNHRNESFNLDTLFTEADELGSMFVEGGGEGGFVEEVRYNVMNMMVDGGEDGGRIRQLSFVAEQTIDVLLGTGEATYVSYTDDDGSVVWVNMYYGSARMTFRGTGLAQETVGGVLTVSGTGVALDDVEVTESSVYSSLNFYVSGGDGVTEVKRITGADPLGFLNASGVNLSGVGIEMTGDGYIGSIQLHNIIDGADILMSGAGPAGGVSVLVGSIGEGTDIHLGSGVLYLSASEWIGGSLNTPWVSSLLINGGYQDGVIVAGNFGANVTLTDGDLWGSSLQYAYVAGSVTGGQWNLSGNAGTIYVVGNVTDNTMGFGGDVTYLYVLGDMTDSTVEVGGAAAMIYVAGDMVGAAVNVSGDMTYLYVLGDMTESTVDVGGAAVMIYVARNLVGSAVNVSGDMTYLYVLGDMIDSTVDVDGAAVMIYVARDLTGAGVNVSGDMTYLYVLGDMIDSTVDIDGNVAMVYVVGDLAGAGVDVTGDITYLYLMNGVTGSRVDVGGDAIMVYVVGNMETGTIDIIGSATTTYVIGNVINGSLLKVSGAATTVYVSGDVMNSTVDIGGDLVSWYVQGDMTDSSLYVGGKTGTLYIVGWLDRSKIATRGGITTVYLGAMRDSTLFVGLRTDYDTDLNADGVLDLPTMGDLTGGPVAEITGFYILGVAGGGDFMINSNIAAHRFGYVSLLSPQLDNGEGPFGVLAGENGITWMRIFHDGAYYYWQNNAWVSTLDAGDLTVVDTI